MVNNLSRVFGLFFVCFLIGYGIIQYTTPDDQISRDPAAIGKIYDFSHLRGDDLASAVKQRLLAGFDVIHEDGAEGLTLGHFVFIDNQGEKKFACQEYDKVSMTFIADGAAVSGETPEMQVEGACEFSNDITRINPLWIPVSKILNEKAADGEFQFNEGHAIAVRFSNLPGEWPHTWVLKSVELKKNDSTDALTIQSDEVSKYIGHPMVLKF